MHLAEHMANILPWNCPSVPQPHPVIILSLSLSAEGPFTTYYICGTRLKVQVCSPEHPTPSEAQMLWLSSVPGASSATQAAEREAWSSTQTSKTLTIVTWGGSLAVSRPHREVEHLHVLGRLHWGLDGLSSYYTEELHRGFPRNVHWYSSNLTCGDKHIGEKEQRPCQRAVCDSTLQVVSP